MKKNVMRGFLGIMLAVLLGTSCLLAACGDNETPPGTETTFTIEGVVSSDLGPLSGVAVTLGEESKTTGTAGSYSFEVAEGEYIGFCDNDDLYLPNLIKDNYDLAKQKGNKGKSRIVGHALKQLIVQSNRVLIMGHKGADMDAFGSSLGIYRMCALSGTEAHIVIDEVNDSLHAIFTQAKAADNYSFITTQRAEKLITKETLIIVLDTHRPSYLERPELLETADRIVVIDHHRKAEDSIENTALSYIESYASSTAELVTEILQYAGGRKTLVKLEAEALLAGMYIDTNRFAVKTGVRTFEAAAWLRRSGADTTEVKRFFQTDLDDFRVRAKCIAAAEFYDNGVAMSVCEGENQEAQVINSQVADELLNIKGIKASFVAGRNDKGVTCVSARSLGEVNVQLIMEKLGGGGHLTTAGAQVDVSPEEVLAKIRGMTDKI